MLPETYEEDENWEVNVAPDSCEGDDEEGEGFSEDDE